MHYEHIQSDYLFTYWMTIKDPDTHPALICQLHEEYYRVFLQFVEKRDFE